jgi:hypothetical protein
MPQNKFITNCSDIIDWDIVIQSISTRPGKLLTTDRQKWKVNENPVYGELIELWEKSNFNFDAVKWINYYPGEDFSDDVVVKLENLLNVKRLKVWISRIDPGWCTPWHWDTDENESAWLKKGRLRRFICFIDRPAVGHILATEEHCFYNEAIGNIYEWETHNLWHAGMNCGLTPKYLFNFLGYDQASE